MWNFFKDHWRDGIEILLLATCIYQIYRAFRSTRGAQILVGLGTILVVLTLVSTAFKFEVIQWLITRAATALAFALIVIFQPELRTGLARLGSNRLFSFSSKRRIDFLERFVAWPPGLLEQAEQLEQLRDALRKNAKGFGDCNGCQGGGKETEQSLDRVHWTPPSRRLNQMTKQYNAIIRGNK